MSEHIVLLCSPLKRNNQGNVLANRFRRRVPEVLLGAAVPRGDYTLKRFANDSVIRRFDDSSEPPTCYFCLVAPGDIEQHVDPADHLTLAISERSRIRHDRSSCAIRALDDDHLVTNRTSLLQRDRHRAFIV